MKNLKTLSKFKIFTTDILSLCLLCLYCREAYYCPDYYAIRPILFGVSGMCLLLGLCVLTVKLVFQNRKGTNPLLIKILSYVMFGLVCVSFIVCVYLIVCSFPFRFSLAKISDVCIKVIAFLFLPCLYVYYLFINTGEEKKEKRNNQLDRWKKLLKSGVITQEEYDAKEKEIMGEDKNV